MSLPHRRRLFLAVSGVILGTALGVSRPAEAALRRYAVLVGSNTGDAVEVELRYAESDAARIGKVLRELGSFAPEDVLTMTDVTAEELQRSLIELNTRIRAQSDPSILFVFYSGHADAESLHLRGTRFDIGVLRDLVYGSSAGARILVIDACRSGAMTRVKGGHPAPSFAIDVDQKLAAEGVAILTSSAAGEDSQESDQLQSSFFTHYLASGLMGAADSNGDGQVTLGEAFSWASERTLVATAGTVAGPQHPTYRFDLGGHSDLVLTEPGRQGKRCGQLAFPRPGTYLVQKGTSTGAVVAEVASQEGISRLALVPGGYFVTLRQPDHLMEGAFAVDAGSTTRVEERQMQEVAYAMLVRKGGLSAPPRTVSTFAGAVVHSELTHTTGAALLEVGSRMDMRPVSLELKLASGDYRGYFETNTTSVADYQGRETRLLIGVMKAWDVEGVSFSVGPELGGMELQRHITNAPPGTVAAGTVFTIDGYIAGVSGVMEARLWKRLYVRGAGEVLDYLLPESRGPLIDQNETVISHPIFSLTGGLGFYF